MLSTGKPHTDIQSETWFDALLPASARPYTRLARLDRPIGAWLLFIPGLWSIWIAGGAGEFDAYGFAILPTLLWLTLLFLVGAVVMRAAGCVVNDLWDEDLDRQVSRTAGRPLASGALRRRHALIFLACLLLIGLVIVLMMKPVVFWLALLSLVFVGLYPLAKRVTHWPQAMLGLTFNFGALMGAAAVLGAVPVWALVLYAGCFLWTIGYDTIYAHQDREDDISVGVKSTALLFGEKTKPIIRALYVGAVLAWGCALWLAGAGVLAWMGLLAAAATLVWQVRSVDIHAPDKCLMLFKFSAWTGWVWGVGLVLDFII